MFMCLQVHRLSSICRLRAFIAIPDRPSARVPLLPRFHPIERNLNVHEHVSFILLKDAGIPVPQFGVAKTKQEAGNIVRQLNLKDIVLKSQVLAGGRRKGHFKQSNKGGIQMCFSPEEAEDLAGQMLGDFLVTKQTGEAGRICNAVMVCERKYPRREFYFAIMMERTYGGPVVIASSEGGVEIEEVAAHHPTAIIYQPVDIIQGLSKETALSVVDKVGLQGQREQIADMLLKLYALFIKKDAMLIEVNPFAEDITGNYYCLDCKTKFDDSSDYRQKELFVFRDWSQEDHKEERATKANLNYIALDGDIACMVNGAGLAMATMDIIKFHGGNPANFLDVGGGSSAQQVKEAFEILVSDPKVRSIFVNIFGGIMRCDIIAEGIIAAARELRLKVPIVCRLQGTNMDKGSLLIANSGLKIISVEDFDEAARLSVKLSAIISLADDIHLDVNFEIPQ
ncbi:beta' subunit [Homalodisca vitripennis]|nr:beta' subunit [Homalodisca vitripennis]